MVFMFLCPLKPCRCNQIDAGPHIYVCGGEWLVWCFLHQRRGEVSVWSCRSPQAIWSPAASSNAPAQLVSARAAVSASPEIGWAARPLGRMHGRNLHFFPLSFVAYVAQGRLLCKASIDCHTSKACQALPQAGGSDWQLTTERDGVRWRSGAATL